MLIHSVRLGFATNSSSTHSILINCNAPVVSLEYPNSFGLDWFHIKDKSTKLDYLSAIVFKSLPDLLSDEMKLIIANSVCRKGVPLENCGVSYIDHQSVFQLPRTFDGKYLDLEFLYALKDFLSKPNVSIRGGNDKDDEIPDMFSSAPPVLTKLQSNKDYLTCRKDGDYFVLFNKANGTKIRVNFKNDCQGDSDYVASSPELVDLKITNFCAYSCPFCYANSTVAGKRADFETIKAFLDICVNAKVFEVTLGGGEPTSHLNFSAILEACFARGISVSFSTRTMSFSTCSPLAKAVSLYSSGFGVSATTKNDIILMSNWNKDHKPQAVLHIPMGCWPNDLATDQLRAAKDYKIRPVLLGYKPVGRAKNLPQHDDYTSFFKYLKAEFFAFGADSVFVNQYKHMLDEWCIWDKLYVSGEGKHSCAVDLVDMVTSGASYYTKKYPIQRKNAGSDMMPFEHFPYIDENPIPEPSPLQNATTDSDMFSGVEF